SLQGATRGRVVNYSLTGDGTRWLINFSYTPGDPISDTAIGVLIYDDKGNVVDLQNAVGNPPHSISFPELTTDGTAYQVQVFNYTTRLIQYTIGVSAAP